MDEITIRFTTQWPWNPVSPVVARLTGSRIWSHVMTIIDGEAFEATMKHACRVVPLAEAMRGVAMYRDMFVPVSDIGEAVEFGRAQDGKPYDFAGAFGLPLLASDDWEDWRKWWCSELALMQVGMAGTWMLDPDEKTRVTPNDLHQCNYRKSELIRLR